MKKGIAIVLIIFGWSGSNAQPIQKDERRFIVDYEIVEGQRLVSTSHLVIADGQTAVVSSDAFSLTSTVSRVPGARDNVRLVASDLSLPGEGDVIHIAMEYTTGPVGHSATMKTARIGRPPIRMTMRVRVEDQ